MEGVSGRHKQSPFDEAAARDGPRRTRTDDRTDGRSRVCVTGDVRGRSCSGAAPDNGAPSWAPLQVGSDAVSSERRKPRATVSVHGKDRSWHRAVKVRVSRGRIAARRSGATRIASRPASVGCERSAGSTQRSPGVKLRARQSGDDTGARVERRLQKLARSIFHVPPRSPARGAEEGRR